MLDRGTFEHLSGRSAIPHHLRAADSCVPFYRRQKEWQLESQLESQLPPKKPSQEESQPWSQPESQPESQLESHPESQESGMAIRPRMLSQEELHEPSQELSQSLLHSSSCRRSRAPSAPPVIADSFDDERDEVLLSEGSPQPSTAESVIARWTSIANRGPCIDLLNA